MADIHITEFYNDTGYILSKLYSQFPRKISLWVEDISGPDQMDEYGLHSERYMAAFHTVLWLAEEKLIRYGDIDRKDGFNHCALTLPAFVILSSPDLPETEKMINRIRTARHEQASVPMEACIREILLTHSGAEK